MTAEAPVLVWFRQDLRLRDNPALFAAVETGAPIACVYILDDGGPGRWRMGGASRWWLHHSLDALSREIARLGGTLILKRGAAESVVPRLVNTLGVKAVFWNRQYEPFAVARDASLKASLSRDGVQVQSFNGALLFEPWTVKTKSGEPFKVFTPFWRACLAVGVDRAPLPAPKSLRPSILPESEQLDSWRLLPTNPNWAAGFDSEWRPGEAGASAALSSFVDAKLAGYAEARDQLGVRGTSRLSPHLHFGEISPRQVWAASHDASTAGKFLSEIGWREFAHNLLFHWPSLPEENWRKSFNNFPWRDDERALNAWRKGETGFPVVDAAMRELWATGYMHNRARMIAASFLVKHLLIDWRAGEDWFWDTLVDADLANNAASWQWVAGSGADAAPYFRIFNPVAQGERYDADGAYVRRWVPELARLPNDLLHKPWEADETTLADAGIRLGATYHLPIVDHAEARKRALAAYAALSSGR